MAKNPYEDLGAVAFEESPNAKIDVPFAGGAQPKFVTPKKNDYSDLGAVQIAEGTEDPRVLSEQDLEGFRTIEINQKKKASILQSVAEQVKRANDLNPINWSSNRLKDHFKQNPPKNVQEQAQANAALELKKQQEKTLTEQHLPEEVQEPEPIEFKGPSNDIRDVPAAFGAGIQQGAMSVAQSALRTPEAIERALGGIGDMIGAPKTREQLKPIIQPIAEGFKAFGHEIPGLNDLADKIHVTQAALAQNKKAFKTNALLAQQADHAFESLLTTGDAEEIGDVITNPVAWASFIGQAVPSLAMAYLSGGKIAFMMWLEAMDTADNAIQFEKDTGIKVSDEEFFKATTQAGIINGALEKIGFDKVFGPLKGTQAGKKIFGAAKGSLKAPNFLKASLGAAGTEAFTEALQAFNSNFSAKHFNESQKILEGVLSSAMGGFGGGAFGGGLSARIASMDQDSQKKRASSIAKAVTEYALPEEVQQKKPVEIKGDEAVSQETLQELGAEEIPDEDEYKSVISNKPAKFGETKEIPPQSEEITPLEQDAIEEKQAKINLSLGSPKRQSPTNPPSDPVLGTTVNAGDMPMRLDRPPGHIPSTSAIDIMDALADAVKAFGGKVPFRVGRIPPQQKALGIFKVFPEVIRIKTANDIPTASHELGHALEKLVFGWPRGGPWKGPLVDFKMQTELSKLGKDLYGDREPAAGYKREGFAEFLRLWLTDPKKLDAKAPTFNGFFEKQFLKDNPDGAKALQKARELTSRFQEQGSVARAKASVVRPDSIKERMVKLKADLLNLKKGAIKMHVEMLEPIRVLTEEAERKLGEKLVPEQDPYFTAKALRTTHDARVRVMVNEHMIDIAGNPVGAPLADITSLVKGKQEDFTAYLWAKRAIALWDDPKKMGGRNPGITREDADQIIKELETPEFQIAAQKVYDWNEGVLNYAGNASPDFRTVVDKIRERDPGFYIPLSREFRDLDNMWARSSARSVKAGTANLSARLKGSGRRIKDPFPQMISNARAIVKATHNRVVLEQIIKLSKVEGMGHLVEKVPRAQVPVLSQTVEELIEKISKQLGPESDFSLEGIDEDAIGQTVTFFMPETRPKGKDPIIPIQNKGNLEFYQVDGELFDALASMEVYRLPSIGGMPLLDWIFGKPARVFRAGTTGMRAAFGLVTNPLRDIQTLYLNSQANVNAFQLLGSWFKSVVDSGFHVFTGKTNDPYLDAFIRLGGEMAQPLGQDIPQTRRAARQLFQGKIVKTIDPRNIFDFIRDVFQFPESGARTAELRAMAKQVGWTPGEPMTLNQSLQLLLAAKEVTTDFTAAGELSRVMNQMVPFYNAAIQGPRANIRAGMRDSKKFFLRGLLALTIPTLFLWNKNKDEEWYKELQAREKFTFWFFPANILGQDILVRIPRSFEVGQFFASMPEAFLDALYRQDPEIAKEWFETFMEVSNPFSLPVLLEESFKQAANKDFYWDRPIVPQAMEKMPAEEQFDEYTSRLAISIGDIFNVSPKRVDHAIRGLFGNVSGDIIGTLGLGPEGVDRETQPADLSVIGTLFKRGGLLGTSPKSVNKMYDLLEPAMNKQYSKKNPETNNERQLRLMLTDATRAVSAILYVRSQTKESKQQVKLTQKAVEIARDVVAKYEAGTVQRAKFKSAMKSYKKQKDIIKDEKD